MRLFSIVVLATFSGSGCDAGAVTAGIEAGDRVVGIIEVARSGTRPQSAGAELTPALAAPDTVTAGEPFAATVTTVGLSGCWRQAGAAVAAAPRRATITPFDRIITEIDGEPIGCTAALVNLPRTVTIVFTQPGEATLRLEGRRVFEGSLASASPLAIEKRIHVR